MRLGVVSDATRSHGCQSAHACPVVSTLAMHANRYCDRAPHRNPCLLASLLPYQARIDPGADRPSYLRSLAWHSYEQYIISSAIIFAIVAWSSFFITRAAAPARVSLGILTLVIVLNNYLTLVSLFPPGSPVNWLSLFMLVSFFFNVFFPVWGRTFGAIITKLVAAHGVFKVFWNIFLHIMCSSVVY